MHNYSAIHFAFLCQPKSSLVYGSSIPIRNSVKEFGPCASYKTQRRQLFWTSLFWRKKNIGSNKSKDRVQKWNHHVNLEQTRTIGKTKEGAICPKITTMNETGIACIWYDGGFLRGAVITVMKPRQGFPLYWFYSIIIKSKVVGFFGDPPILQLKNLRGYYLFI